MDELRIISNALAANGPRLQIILVVWELQQPFFAADYLVRIIVSEHRVRFFRHLLRGNRESNGSLVNHTAFTHRQQNMLIFKLRPFVGREPENSVNVRIKAGRVLQCQEVVVVEAGVLFQLQCYLAVHLASWREADEVVPEFATERCAAVCDL